MPFDASLGACFASATPELSNTVSGASRANALLLSNREAGREYDYKHARCIGLDDRLVLTPISDCEEVF
jgi:hypothetical protein